MGNSYLASPTKNEEREKKNGVVQIPRIYFRSLATHGIRLCKQGHSTWREKGSGRDIADHSDLLLVTLLLQQLAF